MQMVPRGNCGLNFTVELLRYEFLLTASFVYVVRRYRCLRWDQDLKKPRYHPSALIFEVDSWRQNCYCSIS